ncbi:MAG: DNA polymerase I [Fimbriimonadaceae bacterium]|nr:DNA polymerase I [Fimbriimonadaceae bacterium]
MSRHRLIIIDGYSLLFRAFYSTRFMSTTDGRPTNALYGFTGMIFSILEREKPDALVLALDGPGKTFRHAEYAEYKGTRKEPEPELVQQFPWARDLLDALGIPAIEVPGYEADDIVGTISKEAESKGYDTYIVTGDNDQLQLVDEYVNVLTTKVGVSDLLVYTPEKVLEKFGVPPINVPDWKAIVGDSSDNIPGVPGIGEKGATYLLQKYQTIENLLENLDEVEEKYRKKILPVIEQVPKSKWLATICREVPLEYDFEPFRVSAEQLETAKSMLESFEFKSHHKRLPAVMSRYMEGGQAMDAPVVEVAQESLAVTSSEIQDPDALIAFVGNSPFAVLLDSGPAQMSMFDESGRAAYVAVGSKVAKTTDKAVLNLVHKDPSKLIGHDVKPLFKAIPATQTAPRFDTMLAAYVLYPGRSSYSLRDQVSAYLDIAMPETQEGMASAIFLLDAAMSERLEKEGQTKVMREIELPLLPVLAEMENYGIKTSADYLREFSKSLDVTIQETQKKVYEMAGQEFNIGSPKQLGEVLFDKMGIPGEKKTKTGYATGAEILQVLAPEHPIATEVLNWRELTKLKSTYADALPRMIREDGRIHTTYAQAVAATGRLSSNDPNLQNIPTRTELGRQIRKAFTADEGFILASFDYSQIELRLLAHMCKDQALVDAFANHEDVHKATAVLMFGAAGDDVTKEQRGFAKLLNFAVLYGVTDFGLANQLGGNFSVSEAKALITQYYERFPKVKGFTDSVIADAKAKGFTTTLYGRRRYFPDIHAQNRNERLYAERQAMNAPIQGSAADMIKLAMLEVRKKLDGKKTRMLLQVHDELVFELAKGEETGLIEPIRKAMEEAMPLDVPIEVDSKFGPNWNEMGPLEALAKG